MSIRRPRRRRPTTEETLSTPLCEFIDGLAELAATEFLAGGRIISREPEPPIDDSEADQ